MLPSPFSSPSAHFKQGVDCTSLEGVIEVSCVTGSCAVQSCKADYYLSDAKTSCIKIGVNLDSDANWNVSSYSDMSTRATSPSLINTTISVPSTGLSVDLSDINTSTSGAVNGLLRTTSSLLDINVGADIDDLHLKRDIHLLEAEVDASLHVAVDADLLGVKVAIDLVLKRDEDALTVPLDLHGLGIDADADLVLGKDGDLLSTEISPLHVDLLGLKIDGDVDLSLKREEAADTEIVLPLAKAV